MSALQFISNIAWPAAVLVLGFVYRATINELILGRLSREGGVV